MTVLAGQQSGDGACKWQSFGIQLLMEYIIDCIQGVSGVTYNRPSL